jgi:flagellar basal body-associated protein FliL
MKKRFKSLQISLVVAISVLILALPAYLRCTNLSEAKSASSDLSFENPDQANEPPDSENELKVFRPTPFFTIFLLGTNLFEHSSHLFSQALSLRQKNFFLRC